jgi:hypothetical protein
MLQPVDPGLVASRIVLEELGNYTLQHRVYFRTMPATCSSNKHIQRDNDGLTNFSRLEKDAFWPNSRRGVI